MLDSWKGIRMIVVMVSGEWVAVVAWVRSRIIPIGSICSAAVERLPLVVVIISVAAVKIPNVVAAVELGSDIEPIRLF